MSSKCKANIIFKDCQKNDKAYKTMKINLIKILSVIVILLFSVLESRAQKKIKGTVLDKSTLEPLIGANVLITGSSNGTVTDFDGNFTLQITDTDESLTISYTGYTEALVPLTNERAYNVLLSSGELLEQVVVIGYGTIKREDATGSIQSVSSKDFNRGALTGPQELLSGKVAGVAITSSGDPGGGSKIRIRGESSLNANNDPLIVVDGIPLEGGDIDGNRNPLDIVNPNEIETFTVLKDASATAIYGNRAAGGVILITTKKGKSSKKLSIGYAGNVSRGEISNKVDVLTRDEYIAAIDSFFSDRDLAKANLGMADTDWQDQIYQKAFGHEHNLNFSGGLENLPYRLSLGYLNKDGVLLSDNYQRNSLGLNINPGYLDNRLQLNLGVKGS